jgi:hypothetical protein
MLKRSSFLEQVLEQKIDYNLRRRRRKGKWTRECHQSSEKIAKEKNRGQREKQEYYFFLTGFKTGEKLYELNLVVKQIKCS